MHFVRSSFYIITPVSEPLDLLEIDIALIFRSLSLRIDSFQESSCLGYPLFTVLLKDDNNTSHFDGYLNFVNCCGTSNELLLTLSASGR